MIFRQRLGFSATSHLSQFDINCFQTVFYCSVIGDFEPYPPDVDHYLNHQDEDDPHAYYILLKVHPSQKRYFTGLPRYFHRLRDFFDDMPYMENQPFTQSPKPPQNLSNFTDTQSPSPNPPQNLSNFQNVQSQSPKPPQNLTNFPDT